MATRTRGLPKSHCRRRRIRALPSKSGPARFFPDKYQITSWPNAHQTCVYQCLSAWYQFGTRYIFTSTETDLLSSRSRFVCFFGIARNDERGHESDEVTCQKFVNNRWTRIINNIQGMLCNWSARQTNLACLRISSLFGLAQFSLAHGVDKEVLRN